MQKQQPKNKEADAGGLLMEEEEWVDLSGTSSDWKEDPTEKTPRTVVLQLEQNSKDPEAEIDLVNIAGYMGQKWKFFVYILVMAVCAGWIVAAASQALQGAFGGKSYASAVVSFSFDGIDEGKDPAGGLFDVTKLKSTVVVGAALEELGWEDADIEEIRAHLKIQGVIPDSVKQQIAVINIVAEDAAEYYTTIQDLDYFPSRYTVTLYRCGGMNGEETRELLDAILLSYKDYFMDAYAGMAVLGSATEVLDVRAYDYLQASDLIGNEIDVMEGYVEAKAEEAPDFRANSTGLSFHDLESSIAAVRSLDLNNFISFVQANNLTRDAGVQIDYYNYQIRQYNLEIQELQTQRSHVEKTISEYQKDPVIVMSNQESVTETTQKDEYYNELLQQKLDLNRQISELNTKLNEAYDMVNTLNAAEQSMSEEDYAYADALLEGLISTMESWGSLVQQTTEEYFEAELYADAYRITIPAQYSSMGSLGELAKRMALFGGAAAVLVVLLWGMAGLKEEIMKGRKPDLKS